MFSLSLVSMLVSLATPSAQAYERQHQCVYNAWGSGYVAKVQWYSYGQATVDESGAVTLGTVKDEETIAVGQKSCWTSGTSGPMFAVVSTVGGNYVVKSLEIGTGAVIAGGGIVACIGSEGALCPLAAVAIGTVVSGGVGFIPDPPEGAFWAGSPGNVQLGGTIWNPSGKSVRELETGKPAGESCSSNADCSNDSCGRPNADDAPLQCCASGITNYGGYDYCKSMSSGTVCWSDSMCASGNCAGNMSGLQRGRCD